MTYCLQWESPSLEYYWHHNFIHKVYEQRILQHYLGFQESSILADCQPNGYSFYIPYTELERIEALAINWFENPPAVNLWIRSVYKLEKMVSKLPNVCDTNLSRKDTLELVESLEPLFHKAVAMHLVTQPHITRVLEHMLRREVAENDLSQVSLLTQLTHLPPILREQKDWYECVISINEKTVVSDDAITAHLNKWRYITAGDSHTPIDSQRLCDRLKADSESLERVHSHYYDLNAIGNGIRKNEVAHLSLNSHISIKGKQAAATIRACAYIRFLTKQTWMKLWYLIETCLKHIGHMDTRTNIFSYTLEEIREGLHLDDAERRSSYLYVYEHPKFRLFYNGTDFTARQQYIEPIDFQKISGITGEPGYPGVVAGKVLVIGWNDKIGEKQSLVDGDTILVVPQTTPGYISALTKCKGLIVDEGGMTGHASIVSRELGIPSVIGTRFGTRALLDGDIVELDAYSGIVQLLERNICSETAARSS